MEKMCLSIDWDFFTPGAAEVWEDSPIDESLHYLWASWKDEDRILLADRIKSVGVDGFWQWLSKWFVLTPGRQALLSESHAAMHDLLTEKHGTLILFDSHHDCYYLSDWDGASIDCGNWGTHWLRKCNRNGRVIWVSQLKKKHRSTIVGRVEGDLRRRVVKACSLKEAEQTFDAFCKKAGGRIRLDFIHICRSGCWAPPWADKDFLKFIKDSKLDCQITKKEKLWDKRWNPMLDRWRHDKMHKLYEELRREEHSEY